MTDTIDVLKDLVALKTTPKAPDTDTKAYLENWAKQHNVLLKSLYNEKTQKHSFLIGVNIPDFKGATADILLSGHIDTVEASPSFWQTNPFEATEKEGCLFGLGCVDMKAFIAVCLARIQDIQKLNKRVILAISADEETTSYGILDIIKFLKQEQVSVNKALVGEPTNQKLGLFNNGYLGFTTKITGLSCHSSMPHLGINALYIGARLITFIEQLHKLYESSGITLNVGIFAGGKGRNLVAERANVDFEIRYQNEAKKDLLLKEIHTFHTALEKEYPMAKVKLIEKENLPLFKQEESPFTQLVAEVFEATPCDLAYASEAGFFKRLGADTVVIGAGDELLAHKNNEYIRISDILDYQKKLLRLLERI